METIPKSDCREVGFFRKTHGVQGEVVLEYESEFERSVSEIDRYFVELEGLLVPFFLVEDGFRFKTSKTAILNFEGVDSENYARRLIGCPVFLFHEEIIDEEEEEKPSRFVDYLLSDEKMGEIGMVKSVDDYSGNIVLNVHFKGDEILIPFNEDFLVLLDDEQKLLTLKLPDGLFDD